MMKIRIIEYSYPIFVLSLIYFIDVCRDLRKTNDLQDAALDEINKSLSHLSLMVNGIIDKRNKKIKENVYRKNNYAHVRKDFHHENSDLIPNEEQNFDIISEMRLSNDAHDFYSDIHAQEKLQTHDPTKNQQKHDNEIEFGKFEIRKLSSESYYHTSCALVKSLDLHVVERNTTVKNSTIDKSNEILTTFPLQFKLKTDSKPDGISWALLAHDDNNEDNVILDSSQNTVTEELSSPHTLHEFNYFCTVLSDKLMYNKENAEPICYNWKIFDEKKDGFCCNHGPGYFELKINNDKNHIIKDRLFSYELSSSFCITNDGDVMDKEYDTKQEFPSRECIRNECICDSNPSLFGSFDETSYMYDTKKRVMGQMAGLSGMDKLMDTKSPQYEAACWVLLDDPYFDEHSNNTTFNVLERIEERMIQRYILAVFYFSTTPKYWTRTYQFLSSRSECEWNSKEEFYANNIITTLSGILCDDDENIFSILFHRDNLGGTIIDEIHGLKKLEAFSLRHNKNLHGTIPSSLGWLPELRQLFLLENSLSGSIPKELTKATKMQVLHLGLNQLTGNLPKGIDNLKKLSRLSIYLNNLSGELPEELYMLKDLVRLEIHENRFNSSISTMIGNMKNLRHLSLNDNLLTGEIPSSITKLSKLEKFYLDNNTFSGSPDFIASLPNLVEITLHDNNFKGTISDNVCNAILRVTADCRNDVFDSEVSCTCCNYCKDETRVWNGDCPDATMKVVIDHHLSDNFEWSLTNDATEKNILFSDSYRRFYEYGLQSYKVCVAYSDCFSFNHISPPSKNTNYTIYLNDESIHSGTFLGYWDNDDINWDDPTQTILSFQYNTENQRLASCGEIEFTCGEEEQPITLKQNTIKRIMYDLATKTSSSFTIQDTSSPQSKALCWILNNNHYDNKTEISETEFIQRFVLAILHVMSQDGLFGNHEYPPNIHECDWNGITCEDNDTKNVTGIYLSNLIINETIIEELGSLKYLKTLDLSQTKLYGSIPRTFANLWSLKQLNLSGNEIGGTMPATLFHQLNKLELINLSHNLLSGSINKDIGSYSRIRSLLLRDNLLTGSLPLDGFNYYDLEHLDISENELSVLDFSVLLKQKKLNVFDISSNFFVGSLHEDTFTSLTQLLYLNISQNDFSGTIPTTFPDLSFITHFDLHANKLKGTIPLGITELRSIQHLNLQGNKLTGSLPSELNQLNRLNTLALGHNELKGSIPFNQTNLQNLNRLHLQSNKLEGEAPQFSDMTSYITDCGFPSDSLDPVSCSSCNTCCNSDGGCQSKSSEELSRIYLTLIFMSTIVGFIILCYALKDRITSNKYLESFFEEKVKNWNALMLISDKSVYHFLLIENKTEWYVAVVCGIFQTATLFLFVQSADMVNDTSDREYFMLCPANSLKCDNLNKVSPYGIFIFGLILTIWLLRDIIGSVKLMLVSFEKRNIDFFFTSAVVFSVTMLSLWTSIIYIVAIAGKNTDMIKDAVVLLFVVEIDERIFQLAESVNPDWTNAIDRNMRNSVVYEGKNLIISSWQKKYSESFTSVNNMIRRRNEEPPQVAGEDEDRVVRRGSDLSEGFHALAGEYTESSP